MAEYLNNKKRRQLAKLEEDNNLLVQIVATDGISPEHLVIECRDAEDREIKVPKG